MTRVPKPSDHLRPPPGRTASPGSVESLYPFIYQGATDVTAVLAQAGPPRSPRRMR